MKLKEVIGIGMIKFFKKEGLTIMTNEAFDALLKSEVVKFSQVTKLEHEIEEQKELIDALDVARSIMNEELKILRYWGKDVIKKVAEEGVTITLPVSVDILLNKGS